jgi:hypothetical protein
MGEPPGERGHGSKPPSGGWFGKPNGCRGQARARERGLNRRQGPRSGDSSDRPATVRCLRTWRHYTTGSEPVNTVAIFRVFVVAPAPLRAPLGYCPGFVGFIRRRGRRGLRPIRAEHFQFRASHVPALAYGSRGNLGVPIAADCQHRPIMVCQKKGLGRH